MLIETHAHLDYPDFAPDFEDVMRRATDAGAGILSPETAKPGELRLLMALADPSYAAAVERHCRAGNTRIGCCRPRG